ncbi:D-2-hydroxyacid dehydrogenase [Nonomuraea phyllanthi]|uniref:D-2-hydroxyacid dehydrogenase n=1 Tax=Nonomuraea phyllanthi TaxID=2219224 RepID=UPI001D159014|nr:D-2-hydroxyacid dehydrogenase [Nonomuraea phyllanthi]
MDLRVATPATVPNELRASEVYFGWRFAPTWLSLAPSLRWIASPAAGTDHLPVRQAHQAGVMLTRSYGFHGRPMSEHAMGLVLGFSRGLFTSSRLQLTRRWWKDELAAEFFDLAGATMTIVGCGSVGAHLARAAGAFRMNVIGVRRTPPADAEGGIRWVRASSIRGAVAKADVVVGLLPATAETAGFFDQRVFNSCKPGAIFINLGRASTVDHTALLQALEDGPLGGAALDVTTPRPLPMEDALRLHPRVILTPKSATFSRSYMDEAIAFFADNLRRYLNDLPLHGLATPPREG